MSTSTLQYARKRRTKKRVRKKVNPPANELSLAYKTINKQGSPSLEGVKQILRSKKGSETMKVGCFYSCDRCEKPIYDSTHGVVVHGNIYVADPTMRGGLIGNNFPDVKPGTKIEVTDVKETVLCFDCLNQTFRNATINKPV
jgi:hypothetical protein